MESSEIWYEYLKIQQKLKSEILTRRQNLALEARLDTLVAALETGRDLSRSPITQNFENTIVCRERRHARLVAMHVQSPGIRTDKDAPFQANLRIKAIRDSLSPSNWFLILAVAEGYTFGTIARVRKVSTGSLRTKVCRIRRSLSAI